MIYIFFFPEVIFKLNIFFSSDAKMHLIFNPLIALTLPISLPCRFLTPKFQNPPPTLTLTEMFTHWKSSVKLPSSDLNFYTSLSDLITTFKPSPWPQWTFSSSVPACFRAHQSPLDLSASLTCLDTIVHLDYGDFWQNVVHWRREWQTTSVLLPWEPHEQYEKAKR